MELEALGWDDWFERHAREQLEGGLGVGRVAADHSRLYRLYTPDGRAQITLTFTPGKKNQQKALAYAARW